MIWVLLILAGVLAIYEIVCLVKSIVKKRKEKKNKNVDADNNIKEI